MLLAAVLVMSFSACKRDETVAVSSPTSPVLATVGDTAITVDDLLAEAERRRLLRQSVPEKSELLQAMVARAVLIEKAKRSGLDRDPEVRRAMEAVLVGEIRDRELNSQLNEIAVTDQELRAAYDADAAAYFQPAKARLSVLRLESGKSASETTRAELRGRLEGARAQFIADPPRGGRGPAAQGFGALAIENSDDQVSRYKGGDIGWFEAGAKDVRWPEDVLAAGHALSTGEVSPVLECDGDFYLVTKTAERAASTTPFEQAAPALRNRLLAEKRLAAEKAFTESSERLIGVELHPAALAGVEFVPSPGSNTVNNEPTPPALP